MPQLAVAVLAATLCSAAPAEPASSENPAPAPASKPAPDAKRASDARAAEDAARAWLALVDAERYGESWQGAAAIFRQAVPEAQWAQQAAAVRKPLGPVVKRELRGAKPYTSLPGAPDGEYVVLQFETAFARKKGAVETVTPMRDPDGKWRVSGYYIR